MEVILKAQPWNTQEVVITVLWEGRVMHRETFPQQRASGVARLWAEAGYPVTWITAQGDRISPRFIKSGYPAPYPTALKLIPLIRPEELG